MLVGTRHPSKAITIQDLDGLRGVLHLDFCLHRFAVLSQRHLCEVEQKQVFMGGVQTKLITQRFSPSMWLQADLTRDFCFETLCLCACAFLLHDLGLYVTVT